MLLAGATMNYILALIIIILSFGCYGQNVLGAGKIIEDASYANLVDFIDIEITSNQKL